MLGQLWAAWGRVPMIAWTLDKGGGILNASSERSSAGVLQIPVVVKVAGVTATWGCAR